MKKRVNGEEVELSSPSPEIEVSGEPPIVRVRSASGMASAGIARVGTKTLVSYRGRVFEVEPVGRSGQRVAASSGDLTAPMPGLIVDVLVKPGDEVKKGDKVLVLEAMKTQQPFLAPFDGKVLEVNVQKGDQVIEGSPLVKIEK